MAVKILETGRVSSGNPQTAGRVTMPQYRLSPSSSRLLALTPATFQFSSSISHHWPFLCQILSGSSSTSLSCTRPEPSYSCSSPFAYTLVTLAPLLSYSLYCELIMQLLTLLSCLVIFVNFRQRCLKYSFRLLMALNYSLHKEQDYVIIGLSDRRLPVFYSALWEQGISNCLSQ
jgi:hypothetical protein